METDERPSTQLEQLAQIAEILNASEKIKTSSFTLTLNPKNFLEILTELEQFVKIKIDKTQKKVSLDINNVEFIFIKD
jgi:hypothetical protein|tara:strand:- start:571 stop:804 length:234 start_codon:yes stop_codon:yes gene_type:complete